MAVESSKPVTTDVELHSLAIRPGHGISVFLHRPKKCSECSHPTGHDPIQVDLAVEENGNVRICIGEEHRALVKTFREVYPEQFVNVPVKGDGK